MLGFSRGPIDGPVTRGLTARGITAKPPRLCSGGSTPALDAKPMAARGTRSARRRGSAAPIRAGDGKGLDADARTGCGFRVDCRLVHAPPSDAHPASPGNARREMTLLSGSDRLTASHRRVLHPHTDFRESLYVGGLGSSDWPTGAFQQRVRGTQRVALENVHVYCVWISMHKWLAAGVARPSESPFFLLSRFGPTTPTQFDERGCQIHWPIPLTADREKLWPASPEVKRRSKPRRSGSRRRKGRSRGF